MPRGRKTEHGETILVQVVNQLRHKAQVESWAWRFAGHQVRPGWHEHAACKHTSTEAWFHQDRAFRHVMTPMCSTCPVRLDCGAEAVQTEPRDKALVHGVRAGFGPLDRLRAGRMSDRLAQTL